MGKNTKGKFKRVAVIHLRKKLDKLFSLYIRQRDKKCFTCGVVKPWKELQCGHYVSRSYTNLRFNEINCNAQCAGCNIFKKGNLDTYAINLMKKYGPDILNKLDDLKWQEKRFTITELQLLIQKYGENV